MFSVRFKLKRKDTFNPFPAVGEEGRTMKKGAEGGGGGTSKTLMGFFPPVRQGTKEHFYPF